MTIKNSYVITGVIFIALLIAGRWFWHWGELKSAFLLLFFFLAIIGLRLDDIVKGISGLNERLDQIVIKGMNCPSSTIDSNGSGSSHEPFSAMEAKSQEMDE